MGEGIDTPTGWGIDLHRTNDSYLLVADDVLLEPGQSIGLFYLLQSDREPNRSRAEVWFIARNGYGGVAFSSSSGLPVAAHDGNVTSDNRSNQSGFLPAESPTPTPDNEIGVLPTDASGPKDESGGRFDLLVCAVIGIAILAAAFLLYGRIARKQQRHVDAGSLWAVSGIRKVGSEYEATVDNGGKKRTIKLNAKLYKKLIKNKKLTFGKHTVLIPSEK
jgi:hypothetical protein